MLHVKSIPAFNDNYIWLIISEDNRCAVVDPGEASQVIDYLKANTLTLSCILITHHHWDHTNGIEELVRFAPSAQVIGPEIKPIPRLSMAVGDGDQIDVFDHRFLVVGVEGHTDDHIAFVGDGKLFCGDALFSAGCGRLLGGTAAQALNSLKKLASLPIETEVYCAHEYTAANVAFALTVEPENDDLHLYREEVNRLRAQEKQTLPSTIGREKRINPFLRIHEPSVIQAVSRRAQDNTELEVFRALRQWKDEF
ncbi:MULTISPECIES: hydroxyacylglutathione hydrolase [unclassified Salinivibrio]|uniref:hydroxyacylglutathione hydrolase n=1 Tax=unclassified Salinivibrio TaxID=2636825 RepID=UPI000987959C|nr:MULTISPECIES: hydroxyacylglutathione hydrolase [unclassified Salinivibrio]NUY56564.1 hydroxyacylglutathione hydrolase [Salinivibrio sp. EAGSL]OOE89080.1 hydroxyacylglutathione hydrolase [Salinivibrio sp. AR640]